MKTLTHMHIDLPCRRRLAALMSAALFLNLLAETVHASSWSPTLLVNTEAFQVIHEGDGAAGTDVELRFGDTLNEKIYWDRANAEFRFSDDIRADGNITASGTLTISGVTTHKGATRVRANLSGSTLNVDGNAGVYGNLALSGSLRLNKVTYTFPTSDGTASGKVLKTNAAGVLSWSTDSNDGGTGITYANAQSYYVDDTGDSMTGALLIQTKANGAAATADAGLQLEVVGTASGDHLHAQALLTASGTVRFSSGMTLNEDVDSNDVGLIFGSDTTNENLSWQNATDRFEFSDELRTTGNLYSSGTLIVDGTGSIKAETFKINSDASVGDAVLVFGSDTTNETITWQNTPDKWRFSDDVAIAGNLSGSTLNVDGNTGIYGNLALSGSLRLNKVTYTFPTSDGSSSGQVLKTNKAGTLSWASIKGSGALISLHPDYPNALYFGSGSNNVGTLALRVSSGAEIGNTYRWQSTRTTNQDYWIQVRARLPDTYTSWEATPIQLRYRNSSGAINVYMRDTADVAVALTGGSNLRNSAWTTAAITGPNSAGTWTGGGYFTLLLRLTNSGAVAGSPGRSFTDVGFLNFNLDTKLP